MLNQEVENLYNEYKLELDIIENELKDLWYSIPVITNNIDYYTKENPSIFNDILEQCDTLDDKLLILFSKIRNIINEYHDNYWNLNFDERSNLYNEFHKKHNCYGNLWTRCRHCFPVFGAIRKSILEINQTT